MYNNNKKNIMNELVKIRKSTTTGNPVANVISSREIANATGKNHKEVMRDIRSMCMQAEIEILSAQTCAYSDSSEVLVIESEYNVEFGNEGHTRKSKEYLLNEIAAEVLALGYDAKKRIAILKLVKKMKQVIEQQLSLPLTSTTMTIAEVAKKLNTSSYMINQALRENKYFKPNYKPFEKWINQEIFVYKSYNPKYYAKQLRVTDKGFSVIQQLLSGNKIISQSQAINVIQPMPKQFADESRLIKLEEANVESGIVIKSLKASNKLLSEALQTFIRYTLLRGSDKADKLPMTVDELKSKIKFFLVELEKMNQMKSIGNL
jgi:phage regulator Rha-like protein